MRMITLGQILLETSFYRKDITVSYLCLSSKKAAPKWKVGGSTVNSMKVEGGPCCWLCKFQSHDFSKLLKPTYGDVFLPLVFFSLTPFGTKNHLYQFSNSLSDQQVSKNLFSLSFFLFLSF